MNTLTEVMMPHGVEIPAHLEADAEIPAPRRSVMARSGASG